MSSSYNVQATVKKALDQGILPNLERSDEYVINSRGQKLHLRSFAANPDVPQRGNVIFVHGYAAHSNRSIQSEISRQITDAGFGYLLLDLSSHGYSEGPKGFVEDPWYMVDDVLATILALYGEDDDNSMNASHNSSSRLLGNRSLIHLKNSGGSLVNESLFLIGHSMGGATATLAGLCMTFNGAWIPSEFAQEHKHTLQRIGKNFKGNVLVAPLVTINLPAALKLPVETILMCVPLATIPSFLETPGGSDAKIWGNAIYTEYARLDRWPANPNGLSYGTPTYLRTGVSMLTFSELMLKHIPDVTFPFLIIHDKEDKITKYSGSAEAVRLAKSKDKRLIDIPRGLHDPFSNDLHGMLASIIPWLNNH